MIELDAVAAALGILIHPDAPGGFAHLATAWAIGEGEWVTAWLTDEPPPSGLLLLSAVSGAVAPVEGWEQDGAVVGFRSLAVEATLNASDGSLSKRQPLVATGYPSVIDHPAFQLARSSLEVERYHPYCCPWQLDGHLALFSADDGYLTGRSYPGLAGAPVCNAAGEVVGLVLESFSQDGHPPLTRFARLSRGS